MIFALLPLAGLNLWRRNRQRTLSTMLTVMTATMVFSAVMVIPYAMTAIVNKADAVPRLGVTNRACIFRGLQNAYYRKIELLPGVVAGEQDDMVWRSL